MQHVDEGMLRRLVDEAWAVPRASRQHVAHCAQCQERYRQVVADADFVREAFGAPWESDASAALSRHRQRVALGERTATMPGLRNRPAASWRWATAAVGALALLLLFGSSAIGGYAKSLLMIFAPKTFTAVPLTRADMSGLASLKAFGALRGQTTRLEPVADAAAAQAAAGFAPPQPVYVPVGLGAPTYAVLPRQQDSFTLDASKLQAYASAQHLQLPPMPSDIAGSTLAVTTGPAVVLSFGGSMPPVQAGGRMPELVIAQAPTPQVYSTGATVPELENYLLSLPGVSPTLQAEIRSIGDPTSTLPIPIPLSRAAARPVNIQGVQGLAIADETGVGSGVVWQRHGYVYAVVGSLPESEILQVARELQ